MSTHQTPPVKRRRRWLRRTLVVVPLLGVLAVVGLFAAIYAASAVPLPEDAPDPQTAIVYFSDGVTEVGRIRGEENRIEVPIESVPQHVKDAVLAAEDRDYYQHAGLSFTSLFRAAWQDVVPGGSKQGGSTITQQYAKNAFLSNERSFTRKFREASIALKLEREYSKDEILGFYLNTIYFGRGAYGIEAASQAYFGVSVGQLTPAQGIVLADLIRSPEGGDPQKSPETALRRFEATRSAMVDLGTLDDPAVPFPDVLPRQPPAGVSGPNGYLLSLVRDDLEAHGVPSAEINTLGLRIVTTVDKRAQDAAIAAVGQVLDDPANDPQAAVVSIDPATGAVRALYGGRDFAANQFDYATQGLRQPGSSFKPYALVTALEQGISLKTTFNGSSPQSFPGYTKPVSNFGGESFGRIDLATATANSVNTVYVPLALELGPQRVADTAHRLGIPGPGVSNGLQVPVELRPEGSLVLGTSEVHVIDQAVAFSTIAAQGVRHQPFLVQSAADSDGQEVYRNQVVSEKVLDPAVAADATYALQQVVQRGSGKRAQVDGAPTAGKTGTTQESRDAWFVGFTPKLATAVWMGYDPKAEGDKVYLENVQGVANVTGGTLPAQVFKLYMDAALEGIEPGSFPPPAFVGGGAPAPAPAPTSAPPATSAPAPTPTVTETAVPTPTETVAPTPTAEPTRTRQPKPTETPVPVPTDVVPTASPTPTPTATATPTKQRGNGNGNG